MSFFVKVLIEINWVASKSYMNHFWVRSLCTHPNVVYTLIKIREMTVIPLLFFKTIADVCRYILQVSKITFNAISCGSPMCIIGSCRKDLVADGLLLLRAGSFGEAYGSIN